MMITVDEALDRIFRENPGALVSETVPLSQAPTSRVLTSAAARASTPSRRSTPAPWTATPCAPSEVIARPSRLFLAGTSQAGARFVGMMEHGQCVRIFTGAPLPIGADAVIMQEAGRPPRATAISVRQDAGGSAKAIRKPGNDFRRGARSCCRPAWGLTPAMLNLAASANHPTPRP